MKKPLIISLASIAILAIIAFGVEFALQYSNFIFPYTSVAGQNIGGLNHDQAVTIIKKHAENTLKSKLTLNYAQKPYYFGWQDMGWQINAEKTLADAMAVGRTGNLIHRWQERLYGKDVPFIYISNPIPLHNILLKIALKNDRLAQDAGFGYDQDGKFYIQESHEGMRLDVVKALGAITDLSPVAKASYDLPIVKEDPKIPSSAVENWHLDQAQASYRTTFNAKLINRSYNVSNAALALNDILIQPGQTFSFNDVVGPRTSESGYKQALVIKNGEFVPEIGGGACQVSSTLYNAVIRTDLEIVERYNHSLPVDYVPPGMDATVFYGAKDFRFKNNGETPILVKSEVGENWLEVKIMGLRSTDLEYTYTQQRLETLGFATQIVPDPTLRPGQRVVKSSGRNGMIIQVYRHTWQDGKKIADEDYTYNIYSPQKAIIRQGVEKSASATQAE